MKSGLLAIAAVCALSLAPFGATAEQMEIGWNDLLPEQQVYEDPFAGLSYDQLNALATLYRLEMLRNSPQDKAARAKGDEIRAELAAQGLDADALFEQREIVMEHRRIAATEPNPDMVGQSVRLPGYLLPLEMTDSKAVEFLLVPTVGACIHTPPPPPNQIVFVRYPEGFEVGGLYEPVWISGVMESDQQTQSLYFVDGRANIDTTYVVDALSVDPYN